MKKLIHGGAKISNLEYALYKVFKENCNKEDSIAISKQINHVNYTRRYIKNSIITYILKSREVVKLSDHRLELTYATFTYSVNGKEYKSKLVTSLGYITSLETRYGINSNHFALEPENLKCKINREIEITLAKELDDAEHVVD